MIVNGAAIRAAGQGFHILFLASMATVTTVYSDLCEQVDSTGALDTYIIDGGLPQIREWIGERVRQNVKSWNVTVRNREWEGTLAVPRTAVRDDRLGFYANKPAQLGIAAARAPDELLQQVIVDGFTINGYDGVPFFSASHPLAGGATQSNIITGLGGLSAANFETAFTRLRLMKDYGGKLIRPMSMGGKVTLYVAGNLESTARSILLTMVNASGASNPNYGRAELKVFDLLPDGYWLLCITGAPVRPFIYQLREKPQFVARDQPDDDIVWNRNEIEYGAQGSWNVAPGLYMLAVGSTGT